MALLGVNHLVPLTPYLLILRRGNKVIEAAGHHQNAHHALFCKITTAPPNSLTSCFSALILDRNKTDSKTQY